MKKMFLIGIAGGSGSGKTTFTKKILANIPAPMQTKVAILHLDSYYLASPSPDLKINDEPNFDHPEAFDWKLLQEHLAMLRQGHAIRCPVYDFSVSRRSLESEHIGPANIILIEGIYTLWDLHIRSLLDIKIYLQVDSDIRFIRRLHRDVKERCRTLESIIHRYYTSVRPMHRKFLEPTSQYADVIVGEESDVAAVILSAQVCQHLL